MAEHRYGKARSVLVVTGSIVLVLVMLCCGAGAWWFQRNAKAARELAARKDALFVAGYPVDDAGLADYYERHNDNRTTRRWEAMLDYLNGEAFLKTTTEIPVLGSADDPPPAGTAWPELEAARQFLDAQRETLTELHALSALDHAVQFDRQWQGLESMIEVQPLRTASRLLTLEHYVAMHEADHAREYEALDGLIGVALSLRNDPTFVGQLVCMALQGIAHGALDRTLTRGVLTEQQLDHLSRRLLLLGNCQARIECMLAGERALGLEAFENPNQLDEPGVGVSRSLGISPRDALHYLDLIERTEQIAFEPIERYPEQMRAVSQDFQNALETKNPLARLDYLMTSMLTPPLDAIADAFVRSELRNRLSLLAIEVERDRLEHGKFPEGIGPLLDRLDARLQPSSLSKSHFGYRFASGTAELWTISNEGRKLPAPWKADAEPPDPQTYNAEPITFLQTWYIRLDGGSAADAAAAAAGDTVTD